MRKNLLNVLKILAHLLLGCALWIAFLYLNVLVFVVPLIFILGHGIDLSWAWWLFLSVEAVEILLTFRQLKAKPVYSSWYIYFSLIAVASVSIGWNLGLGFFGN